VKDNTREKVFKSCAFLIVITILIGGWFMIRHPLQRRAGLEARDKELAESIETKRQEIAKLLENQRRFKTDADFIETIARQNRRVFPGELIFIFQD